MEVGTLFDNLALGFSMAVSLQNLFWCPMGTIIGTAIGVLPGAGPVATSALLPATYFPPADGVRIMLAGIYYGAPYGGSATSIRSRPPTSTWIGLHA
jgi:putative tricarboxylic transport membrane protein